MCVFSTFTCLRSIYRYFMLLINFSLMKCAQTIAKRQVKQRVNVLTRCLVIAMYHWRIIHHSQSRFLWQNYPDDVAVYHFSLCFLSSAILLCSFCHYFLFIFWWNYIGQMYIIWDRAWWVCLLVRIPQTISIIREPENWRSCPVAHTAMYVSCHPHRGTYVAVLISEIFISPASCQENLCPVHRANV